MCVCVYFQINGFANEASWRNIRERRKNNYLVKIARMQKMHLTTTRTCGIFLPYNQFGIYICAKKVRFFLATRLCGKRNVKFLRHTMRRKVTLYFLSLPKSNWFGRINWQVTRIDFGTSLKHSLYMWEEAFYHSPSASTIRCLWPTAAEEVH